MIASLSEHIGRTFPGWVRQAGRKRCGLPGQAGLCLLPRWPHPQSKNCPSMKTRNRLFIFIIITFVLVALVALPLNSPEKKHKSESRISLKTRRFKIQIGLFYIINFTLG
jgi:hypothetical protein